MFVLTHKQSSASIPKNFKQLMISLTWSVEIDFDLFAVYQTYAGAFGIVYYNDLGNLNAFPFMKLSGDEGTDQKKGEHEESLLISKLSEMKYVWVCAWDYQNVIASKAGRFENTDLKATVVDNMNNQITIPLVDYNEGNTALLFTIDCSSLLTTNLINSSKVTTLHGLNPTTLVKFLQDHTICLI
jgi:uncharacterized protein involved in tellurium resistance